MAAQSSRELWEAAALLGSVSCSAGGAANCGEEGCRGGRGEGARVREERGRARQDLCLSVCPAAGCRRHVSWACSPDPHPATPFHHPGLSPQSVMDGWFGEGGGAQPVGSAPQQPALFGLHWGLLLLNYGSPPFGLISGRKWGRQAFTQRLMCDPRSRLPHLLPPSSNSAPALELQLAPVSIRAIFYQLFEQIGTFVGL